MATHQFPAAPTNLSPLRSHGHGHPDRFPLSCHTKPETIIWTPWPLKDAIKKVMGRKPNRKPNTKQVWEFSGFTTSNRYGWHGEDVKIGIRGIVTQPKGSKWDFSVCVDYDWYGGEPSMGQGGKGYHVVVELSKETFVFCYALSEEYRGGTGPMATRQFWEQLSERASVVGDLAAAEWFMEGAKQ